MNNLKNKIIEKNTIMMGDGNEWFLYSPSDYTYPCYIQGYDEYFNLESIQLEKYKLIGWTEDSEPQEVNGVIYYYQLPVLKDAK